METHRGFPSRQAGTDYHFTLRRPAKGAIPELKARERYRDRRPADRAADAAFLGAIWDHFGDEAFSRGNLDAGRLSWLFGREIVPAEDPFDPASYEALLRVDTKVAAQSFPEVFR